MGFKGKVDEIIEDTKMIDISQKDKEQACLKKVIELGKKQRGETKRILTLLDCEDFSRTKNESPDFIKLLPPSKQNRKGTLIGIEHFLVDHLSEMNENGHITSLGTSARASVKEIFTKESMLGTDTYKPDKRIEASILNIIKKHFELLRKTTYYDYIASFKHSLKKHVVKVDSYLRNLKKAANHIYDVKFAFLIEIRSEFRNLFFNDSSGTRRVEDCIAPLFSEIVDLLKKEIDIKKVDYIILCMQKSLNDKIIQVIAFPTYDIENQIRKQKVKIYKYAGIDYMGKNLNSINDNVTNSYEILQSGEDIQVNMYESRTIEPNQLINLILSSYKRAYDLKKAHQNFVCSQIIQMLIECFNDHIIDWEIFKDDQQMEIVKPICRPYDLMEYWKRTEEFEKKYHIESGDKNHV